jgi:hypothetical protein
MVESTWREMVVAEIVVTTFRYLRVEKLLLENVYFPWTT